MKDIELPPLVGTLKTLPVHVQKVILAYGQACARAAIEADRTRRLPEVVGDSDLVAHIRRHINTYADKHPALLVRQLAGVLRTLLASTPAPAQQEASGYGPRLMPQVSGYGPQVETTVAHVAHQCPAFCTYPACQSTGKTCLGACAKHAATVQPAQQERKPAGDFRAV